MVVLWQIFWRTFAQLELAVVLAAQGMDWSTSEGQYALNLDKLGALTLMALIGAIVAVLWAWASSPAATPVQKALRSAAQALAGGLGAIVLNEMGDIVSLGAILVPLVIAVVLAFLVTYFQNQPQPAPSPPA